MSEQKTKAWLPPRWVKRLAWFTHRGVYRLTGGRLGLWRPKPDGWGTMLLTVTGRRTGRERSVILGYFEDGPTLVTMAMNGWEKEEPAWWLNLQTHPDARVELPDGPRLVTGRAATGEERDRLWSRWREIDKKLDAYAARRPTETAVVVLVRPAVRAAVYDRYGPPEVLRIEDVPTPSPTSGQVLVRVAATSINLSDWETLTGSPLYSRIGGLRSPARRTLGSDIAGTVEAVGDGITRFRPGDEVYGDNLALKGGFAEHAVAAETGLAHKPAALTFAQASTIPQAGAIALQGTEGAAAGRRVLDQRSRWWLGIVRDPARQATRRARDGRGQRREAGVHAVARR